MTPDRAAMLHAWVGAQIDAVRLRSREDILRRQERLWRRLQTVVAQTPALATYADRPLNAFPIFTPAQARADFAGWNTLGLAEDLARAAAQDAECGQEGGLPDGLTAGFSTGSKGCSWPVRARGSLCRARPGAAVAAERAAEALADRPVPEGG